MSAKVQRAEALLERIKNRTGMSEDGKNWLIAVLDPLHDGKLLCRGYPDKNVGPSVTQVIKFSYDIAKPASYGATDVWGCHLWLDDYLCNDLAVSGSGCVTVQNQNMILDATATPSKCLPVGGLSAVAFNQTAGAVDLTTLPPVPAGNSNFPAINPSSHPASTQIASSFLQGKVRKIAEGFEVCNTTAELYRGGSVLVYEQPSSKNDPTAYLQSITTATLDPEIVKKYGRENIFIEKPKVIQEIELGDIPIENSDISLDGPKEKIQVEPKYTKLRFYVLEKGQKLYLDKFLTPVVRPTVQTCAIDVLPPTSVAEAMLLPGTQQWSAIDGCYCTQSMDDLNNPPTFTNTMGSVYTYDELRWPNPKFTPDTNGAGIAFACIPQPDSGNSLDGTINNFKTPFNKKGAIFTGLNAQSTLKVNRTVVLERFISSKDGNLSTLAEMSPCEDYIAQQLYSEISRFMPLGTKFDNNGFGDWFLGVVDSIVETVSSIGKPILGAIKGYQDVRNGKDMNSNSSVTPVTKEIIVQVPQKQVQVVRKPLPKVPQKRKPKPLPKPPVRKAKPLPPIPRKK